jgi:hypothetical protein
MEELGWALPDGTATKEETAKKEIKVEDMADGGEMEDEGVQKEAAEDAS